MAFKLKHLLFWMAVLAFGLVAMFSRDKAVLGKLFDLLTLAILIGTAYGAWLSTGESRAFRVGFLGWAVLYFFLFKKAFNLGISELIGVAFRAFQGWILGYPQQHVDMGGVGGGGAFGYYYPNFVPVSHGLLLLFMGLLGGWVTVYCYRKRQRMLSRAH